MPSMVVLTALLLAAVAVSAESSASRIHSNVVPDKKAVSATLPNKFASLDSNVFLQSVNPLEGSFHRRGVLSFTAMGHTFHVRLTPDNVLGYIDRDLLDSDSRAAIDSFDHSAYYQGVVLNTDAFFGSLDYPHAVGAAHLRIERDGVVRGMIFIPGNDTYVIEPSAMHFTSKRAAASGVYNTLFYAHVDVLRKDNLLKQGAPATKPFCGDDGTQKTLPADSQTAQLPVSDSILKRLSVQRRQAATKFCGLAIEIDSAMVAHIGNTYQAVREAVDMIHAVNGIYRAQATFGFRILAIKTYPVAGSDPYLATSGDKDTLLNTLRNRLPIIQPLSKCLAHLFTFNDFSGTVGYASLPGACVPTNAAGFTTLGGGNPNAMSKTLLVAAHEFGHNFNAVHTTNGGNDIMQATIPSTPSGTFATSSVSDMNTYANGLAPTCLLADTAANIECGNGWVESGEECDCGQSTGGACSASCSAATCTLTATAVNCSADGNPCCDSTTHRFRPEGTVCSSNIYGLDFIPDSTCSGKSPECPDCWPSQLGHPCWRFSNLEPCYPGSPASECRAYCRQKTGGSCLIATDFGLSDANLPEGVCCSNCGLSLCRCNAGGGCQNCTIPADCSGVFPPAECGTIDDGCGGRLSCGSCPEGFNCQGNACLPAFLGPPLSPGTLPEVDASDIQQGWEGLEGWMQILIIVACVLCCICIVGSCFGGKEGAKRVKSSRSGYR